MSKSWWDERYRTGSYSPREYPSDLLVEYIDWLPEGRALDIATGNGRNAVYLARHGYEVDGLDISEEALQLARQREAGHDVEVNWIQADYESDLPDETYDVVMASYPRPVAYERIADIKQSLAPEGVLIYEHHVTDASPDNSTSNWRSNDLLRLCTDLTVVYYAEAERTYDRGKRAGDTAHIASIVAVNTTGGTDSYPAELPIGSPSALIEE